MQENKIDIFELITALWKAIPRCLPSIIFRPSHDDTADNDYEQKPAKLWIEIKVGDKQMAVFIQKETLTMSKIPPIELILEVVRNRWNEDLNYKGWKQTPPQLTDDDFYDLFVENFHY